MRGIFRVGMLLTVIAGFIAVENVLALGPVATPDTLAQSKTGIVDTSELASDLAATAGRSLPAAQFRQIVLGLEKARQLQDDVGGLLKVSDHRMVKRGLGCILIGATPGAASLGEGTCVDLAGNSYMITFIGNIGLGLSTNISIVIGFVETSDENSDLTATFEGGGFNIQIPTGIVINGRELEAKGDGKRIVLYGLDWNPFVLGGMTDVGVVYLWSFEALKHNPDLKLKPNAFFH